MQRNGSLDSEVGFHNLYQRTPRRVHALNTVQYMAVGKYNKLVLSPRSIQPKIGSMIET